MNTKEKLLKQLHSELEATQQRINNLEQVTGLEQLQLDATFIGCERIDFDNLTHEEVIEVIKALGGKWDKEPSDNAKVHYTSKKSGIEIKCYNGTPPPNCKIVEVLEEIPAQPARMVTKRKLVCQ